MFVDLAVQGGRPVWTLDETEYWLDVIASGGRYHSQESLAELQTQLSHLIVVLTTCVRKLRGQ